MNRRIAICGYAQIRNEPDIWNQRFQGMLLDCLEPLVRETGVTWDMESGIRTVITCSDDVFDARTISDGAMGDVVGAHFRGEEKIAQDALNGFGYAMACILSGHDDVLLYAGHCKESQSESRDMNTNLAFDPFYCRPLGLDFRNAAAFQAREYMTRGRVTDEHLAAVVVRSRKSAAKNPFARRNEAVTLDEVARSSMLADPIRVLHHYPVTDWAFAFLLCCEERAREFCGDPVWITGFGNCMDGYYPGERDLVANPALRSAAARAYAAAGITDPRHSFDVIEVNDAVAYQQPLWMEGLGLVDAGSGGAWIENDGPAQMRVNLSGGMLNGNPLMLGGAARLGECYLQLAGKGGERQVPDARRALAHGTTGPCGQHHAVVILEK